MWTMRILGFIISFSYFLFLVRFVEKTSFDLLSSVISLAMMNLFVIVSAIFFRQKNKHRKSYFKGVIIGSIGGIAYYILHLLSLILKQS